LAPPGQAVVTTGHHGEYNTSPRYTAKYQFSPDQMVYVSAAKGFRIGGSNAMLPPFCNAALAKAGVENGAPFDSDSLWSFELGSKNAWLNGRVQSRIAAYRIDWKGIQQTTSLGAIDPSCTYILVANAGAAVSTGGELEVDAVPMDNLTLNFATGYEDARITQVTQAHDRGRSADQSGPQVDGKPSPRSIQCRSATLALPAQPNDLRRRAPAS
jgi:outer membrane receptor protein involved in Fe transport